MNKKNMSIYLVHHTEEFDMGVFAHNEFVLEDGETEGTTLVTVPLRWNKPFELWCNGNDTVTRYDIVGEAEAY